LPDERSDQGAEILGGTAGRERGLPALRRGKEDFEATGIQ